MEKVDKRIRVDWAMRYGNPSIRSRRGACRQDCEQILIVPLYPQYAAATTATVCDEVFRVFRRMRFQPALRVATPYYAEPAYIDALAASVSAALAKLAFKPEVIIASYHGMPEDYVSKGDPYLKQCTETTALLRKTLKIDDQRLIMTFQSRFGTAEWIKPSTDATVKSRRARREESCRHAGFFRRLP
jgi:ferrochelatase